MATLHLIFPRARKGLQRPDEFVKDASFQDVDNALSRLQAGQVEEFRVLADDHWMFR
jgi:hypothetical protein